MQVLEWHSSSKEGMGTFENEVWVIFITYSKSF